LKSQQDSTQMKNYINVWPCAICPTIYHIFKAYARNEHSILSQNTALSKIALRTRRKICEFIVRQVRTILSFRSSTLADHVA